MRLVILLFCIFISDNGTRSGIITNDIHVPYVYCLGMEVGFLHPQTLIFLLCSGGYLYFVYYCIDKYLEDNSVTNTRYPIYTTIFSSVAELHHLLPWYIYQANFFTDELGKFCLLSSTTVSKMVMVKD
jgi:hypothetical protein